MTTQTKNIPITKKMTSFDFYDELDKFDEIILENFLENDLLDSQMMTWYEEKPDENEDDFFIDDDCDYCHSDYQYEYCSCAEELSDEYENETEWETIRYK